MGQSEVEIMEPGAMVRASQTELVNGQTFAPEPIGFDQIMLRAVDTGNIETLERIVALKERMDAKAAENAFYLALGKFQRDCPVIKRKKAVTIEGKVRYRYAPLDAIIKTVGPILTAHGLSYTIKNEFVQSDGQSGVRAVCEVHHVAGFSASSEFVVPVADNKNMTQQQHFGSANTFAKRYAFMNAFGIMTGDDDDNDGNSGPTPAPARTAVPREPVPLPQAKTKSAAKPSIMKAGIPGEEIPGTWRRKLIVELGQAGLSEADFKKRFGFLETKLIRRCDWEIVTAWVKDPRTA